MKVAFFNGDSNITSYDVVLSNSEFTTLVYDGSQRYKAVLLNYQDEAFIKILLDDASIEFFKANLHNVKDELTRTLIWRSFYDMVRDGKLSSEEYVDTIIQALPHEQSDEIISNQFSYGNVVINEFTPRQSQPVLATRLFEFAIAYL